LQTTIPVFGGQLRTDAPRVGFEVETATDGLKALIKASRYNPDILIIDVHDAGHLL
jgi:DNA-binding response OmpR family regulator